MSIAKTRAFGSSANSRSSRTVSSFWNEHAIDFHDLVWEAPTRKSQTWFIRHFGPDVNLGNIPPEEVIPLETLRLGLRGDTLREVLLGDAQPDLA